MARLESSYLYCFCLCAISTRFLESIWFVWVTQMNHIPMHIDYDRNMDWVSTQVRDGHLEDLGIIKMVGGHRGRLRGKGSNIKAPKQHHLISLKLLLLLSCPHSSLKESGQLWLDAYLHQ